MECWDLTHTKKAREKCSHHPVIKWLLAWINEIRQIVFGCGHGMPQKDPVLANDLLDNTKHQLLDHMNTNWYHNINWYQLRWTMDFVIAAEDFWFHRTLFSAIYGYFFCFSSQRTQSTIGMWTKYCNSRMKDDVQCGK